MLKYAMDEPFVSIIIPVKNDAYFLKNCLESINLLDYPKDKVEVIIADGLSIDNSLDIARQYGAKVIINQKKTVSPGRNIAFESAKGELVAFTDADCVVDSNWLKNAVKYFNDKKVVCVGGPNLTPPEDGSFSKAVGFVFGQRIFAAGSIHARNLKEIKEVRSIPGCNAIYRKSGLDLVMPIDESLLTCDDTELNQRLLDNGFKLLYTPDVFVWHYRRPNPKKLWRQMYRYAIGRLQVGKRDKRMINMTHIIVGMGIPSILLVLALALPLFLFFSGIILILFFLLSAYSLLKTGSLSVSMLIPVVVVIIFFAWSAGFMRELIFPMKKVEGK